MTKIFPDARPSPLWDKALKSYHEELAADDDYRTILQTGSLEELLADEQILKPFGPHGRKALESMNRLKPTFKMLNDFSVVLAVSLGAGTAVTALVWGSIRMILTLASTADNILHEVSDMLEELSLTLPRLKAYEKNVPMDSDLEESLLTVYQEVICFYARAIHFFRCQKHAFLLRNSWSTLRGDFQKTVQRIKRLSATIDTEIELTRMRQSNQKYHEVLELMETLHPQQRQTRSNSIFQIPSIESPRFWGREDILALIDEALVSGQSDHSFRSFALYGMGGVGKTQIALKYANASRAKFDAIFWVSADNLITIGQSFRRIADTLGLSAPDTEHDDNSVMLAVKKWLSTSEIRWLLVYDNADDLDTIGHAWPAGCFGSILLTSRDSAAAFTFASKGCQVKPFDTVTGSRALLNILGFDPDSTSNQEDAMAIATTLGGLPLALNQIGGFILQRKVPLKSFLSLYERNSASVNAKGGANMNYKHTIATVWEMALDRLSGDARFLQMILSFLDPDNIDDAVLKEGAQRLEEPRLKFILDEIELLDAQKALLQGALMDKSSDTGIVSVHRLVQRAVIQRMSIEEREATFAVVVAILAANFPDTYNADLGHQVKSWTYCERSLPHIESLVKKSQHFKISEHKSQNFAELLLRCSWWGYLYERERYTIAQSYITVALTKFVNKHTLAYASAIDLQGLINLDICRPGISLAAFQEAYEIRTSLLPKDDVFLAANQVNLGLAYTELGELEKGREYLQQSIDVRLMHNSDRIGNSYSNMASLLLRMGKPDEAEAMLKSCPALKDFSDETFLRTGNPRFSGDMILLGRIRLAQGRLDEALRFSSKALSFRKECLGERLKVCDSLYQVSDLFQRGGNTGLAIQFLEGIIRISGGLPQIEGAGHRVRAHYKLSGILKSVGNEKESIVHLEEARTLAKNCDNGFNASTLAENEALSFNNLVPWMLW
ncbi:TPR-like protein [Aspergillus fijiensis CBS 313.89]|uniref:TPR-like protein n=1 Tax=Aspergillus fijiensis CBS 313.89 TaxID=1448319 RepID=A0A8G1S124_9EURO|nr:TPR-like protein [Aspergillus fijiensis CBS 313.89]RAK81445.1 TPR-like protein [Aspergillus fijiensis CBS 313.89]